MKETSFILKLFGIKILSVKIVTELKDKVIKEEQINTVPTPDYPAPQNPIGMGNIRPDLKELEKQVLNIDEQPEPIKVTCQSCKGVTYDDDINFCSKCGKEICSNCGSVITEGGTAKCYCEECWKDV